MNAEYKKRLWIITKPVLVFGLVGGCYYVFTLLTDWRIPCLIYLVTGKICPGCGITRMCLAILQGDFHAAFLANRFLFILLPWALAYGVFKSGYFIVTGESKMTKTEQVAVIILYIATIVFWILRNMDAYSFLAPMG